MVSSFKCLPGAEITITIITPTILIVSVVFTNKETRIVAATEAADAGATPSFLGEHVETQCSPPRILGTRSWPREDIPEPAISSQRFLVPEMRSALQGCLESSGPVTTLRGRETAALASTPYFSPVDQQLCAPVTTL